MPTGTPSTTTAGPNDGRAAPTRRLRVILWYVVLFALALVAAVVPIQRVLNDDVDETVAARIEDEVDDFRLAVTSYTPAADRPAADATVEILGDYIALAVPGDGEVLMGLQLGELIAAVPRAIGEELATPERVTAWAQVPDGEWTTIDDESGEFRVLSVRVGETGAFVVAIDLDSERAGVSDVIGRIVLAAAGALVVGGLLSWLFSARKRAGAVDQQRAGPEPMESGLGSGAPSGIDDERFRLVDAGELTGQLVEVVRSRHRLRQWQLTSTASGDLVCDPDRVRQAIISLADNVAGRTASGDSIRISSDNERDGVRFSVANEGPTTEGAPGPADDGIPTVVVAADDGQFAIETTGDNTTVFSFSVPRRPPGGDQSLRNTVTTRP